MNIFKQKTTWTNMEFVPFKLCIAAAYLIAGTYFHEFFQHYYVLILVVFLIMLVWTLSLWIGKMKRERK